MDDPSRMSDIQSSVRKAVEDILEEGLCEETDLHTEVAKRVFGDDFTPDERALAKRLAFRTLYGPTPAPRDQVGVCKEVDDEEM